MNIKIKEEVEKLTQHDYRQFCDVLGKIIKIAELTPNEESIRYKALRKWYDSDFHDDFLYLSKLQSWDILKYKQVDDTDDCLITASLGELNEALDLIWDTLQKKEDEGWKKLQEEEAKKYELEESLKKDLSELPWSNDFIWNGDNFVFGSLGKINFNKESIRKSIFKALTNERGGWVTVRTLSNLTKRDRKKIRPVVGQIRARIDPSLKRYVKIISTRDESSIKEQFPDGAYRIKIVSDKQPTETSEKP